MILKNKTALVTGGSQGIGKACVLLLAREGARVIFTYHSDESAAQETAQEASANGSEVLAIRSDACNQNDIDSLFTLIREKYGQLDLLVNNAGGVVDDDAADNIDAILRTFDLNLFSAIRVTSAARALMSSGKIIFMSSIHGKLGNGRPDVIGYSSAKAALNSYMQNLAKELAPNILVNAVAPGRTVTPAWGNMTEQERAEEGAGHLFGRMLKPHEIADAVVFVAKNDAMCGEILVVDGGMQLKTLG